MTFTYIYTILIRPSDRFRNINIKLEHSTGVDKVTILTGPR